MKKCFKSLICVSASLMMATSAFAETTELYALDGRTIEVESEEVELYIADGMGWFLEKPVTMYALDGRDLVVPADRVEAYQAVGWYLEDDLKKEQEKNKEPVITQPVETTVNVQYKDGTVVNVPVADLEAYKTLGWIKFEGANAETVIMYDASGNEKAVLLSEVAKYESEGWSKTKPEANYITVYSHTGEQKKISPADVEAAKAEDWYPAFDEAVYAYAAFGDGKSALGAVKLLEDKKYEAAFGAVDVALEKLGNAESDYVPMLRYLRSNIVDTWREAAGSPLGFINYWFDTKDGKRRVVFEYRNVSNNRIQKFGLKFDVCDEEGNVIEVCTEPYEVKNLEMAPYQKKRVGWELVREDSHSIKNLKVAFVEFSDGTKWTSAR